MTLETIPKGRPDSSCESDLSIFVRVLGFRSGTAPMPVRDPSKLQVHEAWSGRADAAAGTCPSIQPRKPPLPSECRSIAPPDAKPVGEFDILAARHLRRRKGACRRPPRDLRGAERQSFLRNCPRKRVVARSFGGKPAGRRVSADEHKFQDLLTSRSAGRNPWKR
jgi:hypothetical protein